MINKTKLICAMGWLLLLLCDVIWLWRGRDKETDRESLRTVAGNKASLHFNAFIHLLGTWRSLSFFLSLFTLHCSCCPFSSLSLSHYIVCVCALQTCSDDTRLQLIVLHYRRQTLLSFTLQL